MSDLVGNPCDRFSHNEAHIIHSLIIALVVCCPDSIVQVYLNIMLSLGSMEKDCVISEICYNEVIYIRTVGE